MQLTRKALLFIIALLVVIAASGAIYLRYRVNKAVAECATPAPPDKPATPPPNLPGFQAGEACGPGETPAAPGKAATPARTGKDP